MLRHPELDFATTHFYEQGTIDDPRDTVAPALSVGRLTRAALDEIRDQRPFLDSEHGPIHIFKDRRRTLPEGFDDEYFRHIQWAHFASGGAGGGMRWPNRHPHVLTPGMRRAQQALASAVPLIDWPRFQRRNLNAEIEVSTLALVAFGCGDAAQAIVWLLRKDGLGANGQLRSDLEPVYRCCSRPWLLPQLWRRVPRFVSGLLSSSHIWKSGRGRRPERRCLFGQTSGQPRDRCYCRYG